MLAFVLNALPGLVISGYQSFIQTFGSVEAQLAISVTLVVIAAADLCLRKCRKPAEVA